MNDVPPHSILIISGGEYSPLECTPPYDYVIACDKGYENALRLGIVPNLVIGDFDSYDGKVNASEIIRLPQEKDDTDTMAAVRIALQMLESPTQSTSSITICCALGGRFDHTFANIQTAAFIAEKGITARIEGINTSLYAFSNGEMTFDKKKNHTLSVFSLSNECTGVTLLSTKYSLNNATITNRFPIGVSNEWNGETATIKVGSGIILVIISHSDTV